MISSQPSDRRLAQKREASARWLAKIKADPALYKAHLAKTQEYRSDPVRREAARQRAKDWAKANPEGMRDQHCRRNYGLSYAEYVALLHSQNSQCAICQMGLELGRRKLNSAYLDHDHVTGKVRQFLCLEHNTGLGKFGDSPDLLEAAAAYLRRHGK